MTMSSCFSPPPILEMAISSRVESQSTKDRGSEDESEVSVAEGEDFENKTKSYKPTGRPAGWHFMNEFVDKDGNVFHKGVEQPKLKGTLKPTKVKPKKKVKRKTKDEILVARHKEKLAVNRQLKKDLDKQKKFLMGDVEK